MAKSLKHITALIVTMISLFTLPGGLAFSNERIPDFQIVGEVWEPYQYPDKSGDPAGFATQVVAQLLKQAKIAPREVEFYPWVRAYKKAQTERNMLILSLSRIPEREDKFIWIGKISSQYFQFYALKTNSKISKAKTLDDIFNYTIVVSKNSALDKYLTKRNFPNVERILDNDEAYQMLAKERADLMFKAPSASNPEVKFEGYSDSDLKVIYTPSDAKNDFYLALSKDSSPDLAKRLQKAFKELVDSGIIEALQTNWNI